MSDTTQVSTGEPEEVTGNTENAESPNTPTDKEQTSTPKTEEGEEKDKAQAFDESLLDNGKDDSKSPQPAKTEEKDAFANKQSQINTWAKRFDGRLNPKTNEPYTLDDVPHEWLKQEVSDKLHELEKPPAPEFKPQTVDDNSIEKFEFHQLKKQIPNLPKTKQEEIAALFRQYKNDGIQSDHKALQYALDRTNIETEAEKRGKKAAYMKVPGGGSGGGVNSSNNETQSQKEMRHKLGISDEKYKKLKGYDFMKTLNPNN